MKEGDLVAGRYRLLRPIGAGGMGTVWAARHELLGRELALKLASVGASVGDRARCASRDLFLREVRIVGKLRHPNVVDIADAGEAGGDGLYLAMELLVGESLAQRIAQGPVPPGEALAIAAEVCRGLAAAHAAGVVHRDLKPENVFLARGPAGGVVPKLLDFGVSSARGIATLHRGKLFGTPAYMSPEQALGEAGTDHRTDVWALGVVLYEMLTAQLPFQASSYPALLPLIIETPYPALPASLPGEVRTVVAGCLAKDRGDRYPTADALLEAIERARASLPAGEPSSGRSGFFIETGGSTAPSAPAFAGAPGAATARTARFGLVIAILAVPLAVGIAAMATGMRTHRAPAAPLVSSHPAELPDATASVAVPVVPPVDPRPDQAGGTPPTAGSATSSARSGGGLPPQPAQPAGAPSVAPVSLHRGADHVGGHPQPPRPAPPPRPRVTNVNNAGF